MRRNPENWVRTVVVVWIAELIALMGMSMIMPFLPLYLKDLGVADRDASFWAGWVGGANFFCSALLAPVWGTVADRFGRKPMALRALLGLAVSVFLMSCAQNVYQLFFLRMIQGAFGGFVSAAIALVGTTVPRERLGSAGRRSGQSVPHAPDDAGSDRPAGGDGPPDGRVSEPLHLALRGLPEGRTGCLLRPGAAAGTGWAGTTHRQPEGAGVR